MNTQVKRVAIIGAGITGLTIANELKGLADITVFEKSRGMGGRMATRRTDDYHFDHGAQYFVAKTQSFQDFLKAPLEEGAIARWDAEFIEFDGSKPIQSKTWSSDFPHYVGTPTMSALGRFLAKDIDVKLGTRVSTVDGITGAEQRNWLVKGYEPADDQNETALGEFDWVIFTSPVEQTRALMPARFKYCAQLEQISMMPCFSLMLGYQQAIDLPFQAALVRNSDISWIAVNSHKPERPNNTALLIQSSNEWAQENVDLDKQKVLDHLLSETENVVGTSLQGFDYSSVHRWLYANSAKQRFNKGEVYLDQGNRLGAAGDWCGNARVESAFLHGMELAEELKAVV